MSTTAFAGTWARFLVRRFLDVPLLSADPFELDWWVRAAQQDYPAPDLATLAAGIFREKAEAGSASTLAAARVHTVTDTKAEAALLAIGDSCILLAGAAGAPLTFPDLGAGGFDAHPVCLHSQQFDRAFHRGRQHNVHLHPGDLLILATDAVARWALEAGARGGSPHAALRQLEKQALEPAGWGAFIEGCRTRGEMVDDDATALVVQFVSGTPAGADPLGTTVALPEAVRLARQSQLDRAIEERNRVEIARLLGDSALSGMAAPGYDPERTRRAADAIATGIAEVVAALGADPPTREAVQAAWQRHAELLAAEPAARKLRRVLSAEDWISDLANEELP